MSGTNLTSCAGFVGTTLDVSSQGITAVHADAFAGLTSLTQLNLAQNALTVLPLGVFDGLANLTILTLNGNQLATLPAGLFDDLTGLQRLRLYDNQLAEIADGLFNKLTALIDLTLYNNLLASVPADLVATLPSLSTLRLNGNALTTLPAGLLDATTRLTILGLNDNQLTSLPEGLLQGTTSLTFLWLSDNKLTTLPAGFCDALSSLTYLDLHDNQLTSLPPGVFDTLTSLTHLRLESNQLRRLPPFLFVNLIPTCTLLMAPNPLMTKPCGIGEGVWQDTRFGFGYCTAFPAQACSRSGQTLLSCAGFTGTSLLLRNLNITALAPGSLAGLTLAGDLDLSHNTIASVPAGVFTGTATAGTISLAYNALVEVPLTALGDVSAGTVDMSHNPLLRLPSAALLPHYSDFVTAAFTTPVVCKDAGSARFGWKGSSFCTQCLPGNYCPAGVDLPTSCPVGTFNSLFGQSSDAACVSCAQGTFGDTLGAVSATSCAYCPAGTWSAAVGATSIAVCTPCQAGNFASGLGNAACTACAAGTFQSQPGQATCVPCPAGTYGAATGAASNASCTACPADRPLSQPGSVLASDCSSGDLQSCSPGWHYLAAGGGCVQCTAGYACAGGFAERVQCPPGSYTEAAQATECTLCTAGSYSTALGGNASSSCVACQPGTVSAADGAAMCTPCAAGTSQALPGKQTCTPCPDGTLCPAGSAVPLPLNLAPAGVSALAAAGGDGGVAAMVPLDGAEEANVAGSGASGDGHSAFGAVGTWAVPVALVVVATTLVAVHKRIPSSAPGRLDLFSYSHTRADNAAVRKHPTRLGFACSLVFLLAALLLTWSLWTAPNEVYTTALATKAEVARRQAATSTLQLRVIAYGVDDESKCVGQVSATALGVGSADGGGVPTAASASSTTVGTPSLQVQHDAPTQRCTITVACSSCALQPSAAVTYVVPWHFQLLGWNVSAVSPRATSSVGGTAAPQAGGLLSGSAAFEVAWVPSFLVVESDGGEGEVQESGHLLQFRSAQAQQVAASGAGVSSGSDSTLKLEFAFPISDVGHTTVVQTAQTVQQRAASILAAVVSVLSAARFLYTYVEDGVDAVEGRVAEHRGGHPLNGQQSNERRSSVGAGVTMMRLRKAGGPGNNDAREPHASGTRGGTKRGHDGSASTVASTMNPIVEHGVA